MTEPTPQLTPESRTWGMLSHLLSLLGYVVGLGHILPPLIIYLSKKDQDEFVKDQARESLNFQITVLLMWIVCLPLCCILIGYVLAGAVLVYHIVFVIVAAMKAHDGVRYRYPLTLRLIS